jgi:hypothetical protein
VAVAVQNPKSRKASTAEKRAWLRSWLDQPGNIDKSTEQIRQAVRDQFGQTLGTSALNAIIKEAKRMLRPTRLDLVPSELQPRFTRDLMAVATCAHQAPVREAVKIIKAAMESCGIETIRITPDGKVDVTLRD